jgi:hypothetical protein
MLVFIAGTLAANPVWSEESRCTLELQGSSVEEALAQIGRTCGIDILMSSPMNSQIDSKSFQNQTVEEILKAVLYKNYLIVWGPKEKGKKHVCIWVIGAGPMETKPVSKGVPSVKKKGSAPDQEEQPAPMGPPQGQGVKMLHPSIINVPDVPAPPRRRGLEPPPMPPGVPSPR